MAPSFASSFLFFTSSQISMAAFILILPVRCQYVVACEEFVKFLSPYPIMASRESKRVQLPSFYPAQYRRIANPTAPRHKTNSHIFWIPMLKYIWQINLLTAYRAIIPKTGKSKTYNASNACFVCSIKRPNHNHVTKYRRSLTK